MLIARRLVSAIAMLACLVVGAPTVLLGLGEILFAATGSIDVFVQRTDAEQDLRRALGAALCASGVAIAAGPFIGAGRPQIGAFILATGEIVATSAYLVSRSVTVATEVVPGRVFDVSTLGFRSSTVPEILPAIVRDLWYPVLLLATLALFNTAMLLRSRGSRREQAGASA